MGCSILVSPQEDEHDHRVRHVLLKSGRVDQVKDIEEDVEAFRPLEQLSAVRRGQRCVGVEQLPMRTVRHHLILSFFGSSIIIIVVVIIIIEQLPADAGAAVLPSGPFVREEEVPLLPPNHRELGNLTCVLHLRRAVRSGVKQRRTYHCRCVRVDVCAGVACHCRCVLSNWHVVPTLSERMPLVLRHARSDP